MSKREHFIRRTNTKYEVRREISSVVDRVTVIFSAIFPNRENVIENKKYTFSYPTVQSHHSESKMLSKLLL